MWWARNVTATPRRRRRPLSARAPLLPAALSRCHLACHDRLWSCWLWWAEAFTEAHCSSRNHTMLLYDASLREITLFLSTTPRKSFPRLSRVSPAFWLSSTRLHFHLSSVCAEFFVKFFTVRALSATPTRQNKTRKCVDALGWSSAQAVISQPTPLFLLFFIVLLLILILFLFLLFPVGGDGSLGHHHELRPPLRSTAQQALKPSEGQGHIQLGFHRRKTQRRSSLPSLSVC